MVKSIHTELGKGFQHKSFEDGRDVDQVWCGIDVRVGLDEMIELFDRD